MNLFPKSYIMNNELYSYEGLLVLIDCLNEIIDNSGKRGQLVNSSKDKIMAAYEAAKNLLPVETINEQLKISNQKLFRLRASGKCDLSISKSCLKLCPMQLSVSEQSLIKAYLNDKEYENLPVNHIWSKARRDGLYVSVNTFYKYVRRIRGKTIKEDKEYEAKRDIVTSSRSFEILHMDSTTFRCQNGERVYVHFIMDNYSRKVLGAVPSFSSKSVVVANNLKSVISNYNLYNIPFEIYSDDGPENHGDVNTLLKDKSINVTKVVANYQTRKSNNMIEAWNKKFKHIILKKFKIKSFIHLEDELPFMLDYFNNLSLPVLNTLSPNEVATGVKYEDLEIKERMDNAKALRLGQNREFDCKINFNTVQTNFSCQTNFV